MCEANEIRLMPAGAVVRSRRRKRRWNRAACVLILVFCAIAFAPTAHAEDWPMWRGPRGDGSSNERRLPTTWSPTDNIAWKTEIPGRGHASPIVWGDRVFVVSARGRDRLLICIDRRTGAIRWERVVLTAPLETTHRLNGFASSTPATDGERVYVSFQDGRMMYVAAWDFEGRKVWEARPGRFYSQDGYCASPVVWRDRVFVNGDQDGPCFLIALDRKTGRRLWKALRQNDRRSYCTPIVRRLPVNRTNGRQRSSERTRDQLILAGTHSVSSYDPMTGARHWFVRGPTKQFVASLVESRGLILVTAGFPERHLMAIDPTGRGDVTDSHVVWHRHKSRDAAYVPSPAAVGDHLIVATDFGWVSCFDVATGKQLWREKLERHYSASAVSANGLVYITADHGLGGDDKGVTTVIRPGRELDIVARNVLDEAVYASPAISQGQLFIRGERHLFCIGKP